MSTVAEGARLYRERNGIAGEVPVPAQVAPTRTPTAQLTGDPDRDGLVTRFLLDEQEAGCLSGTPDQMNAQAKRLNDLRGVHRVPEFARTAVADSGNAGIPVDTSSVSAGRDLYKKLKDAGFK